MGDIGLTVLILGGGIITISAVGYCIDCIKNSNSVTSCLDVVLEDAPPSIRAHLGLDKIE
jgi:hypothetical protein